MHAPLPRYEILYTSLYDYDAPVVGNHNALRMKPTSSGTQRLEHFDIRVSPDALTHRFVDLFGNDVVELLVAPPHEQLSIEVDALVTTTWPLPPPDASWASVRTDEYRVAGSVYRYHPVAVVPDGVAELVDAVRRSSPRETAEAVMELIPDRFAYRPGATEVGSTVSDFLRAGAGVCQDFAHLGLMLLREHDIAGRYVSGYFFTSPDPGGASAEVETHAWVEALLPVAGDGDPVWVGLDPTNRIPAGANHVKIGHGRHYPDVPPVRGTFAGSAQSQVDAQVRMREV